MMQLAVHCPLCGESIMCDDNPIEGHPSVHLHARTGDRDGVVRISSVYGSTLAETDLDIGMGDIVEFSCPNCSEILPEAPPCRECSAPMVRLRLADGPGIIFCSRRGCPNHSIRFGEWEEVSVGTIMRRGVVSVTPATPLKQILPILVNTDVNHIPVVDREGRIRGEVSVMQLVDHLSPWDVEAVDDLSYRDLLRRRTEWDELAVTELMVEEVPMLDPDDSLEAAVRLYRSSCRPSLLVSRDGRILGAVHVSDLLNMLIEHRREL